MSKILSQALVRHLFDYKDGALYWKNPPSPSPVKVGARAGTFSATTGYRQVSIHCRLVMEHRVIFLWHTGTLPAQVDHIDRDRCNNRIENLRAATVNENRYNSSSKRNNKSGVRNVWWDNSRKKWRVAVRKDGQIVFSARFDDLELAELVAIEARSKYHGEFACHQ